MSAPVEPRGSAVWRRALLPVAITIAVTMILLGALDATKSARRLPPQVAFIPVESKFVVVTSSLDSLWSNFGNHAVRLADREPYSFWDDINEKLALLMRQCITFENTDDLTDAGLDPSKGLSFAWLSGGDFLLTLPISDRDRALETVAAFSDEAASVYLSHSAPGSDVTAIRVTPQWAESAVLCAVPPGAPLDGKPQILTGPTEFAVPAVPEMETYYLELELLFAARGIGEPRLAFTCEVLLRDGGTQPCDCDVPPYPEGSSERCDEIQVVSWNAGPQLELLSDFSETQDEHVPVWETDLGFFSGLFEDRLLIASDPELVSSAAERREERSARLLGDNALIGLVDQFYADAIDGEATVLGLIRDIESPVADTLPFGLTIGPNRARLRAALSLDPLGFDVLNRLISPSAAKPLVQTSDAPLTALLNDPAIGAYFTVADRLFGEWNRRKTHEPEGADPIVTPVEEEIVVPVAPTEAAQNAPAIVVDDTLIQPGEQVVTVIPEELVDAHLGPVSTSLGCASVTDNSAPPSLYDKIGSFAPLARGLTKLSNIGPLEGYLLDVRDGVPEIVLVQHGLAPETMEQLVYDTRSEMKQARDVDVLCRARTQFWRESGGPAFPVYPNSLLHYLGAEGPELLNRYDLQEEIVKTRRTLDQLTNVSPVVAYWDDTLGLTRVDRPPPVPYDFDIPTYRDGLASFDIYYLPPPITDLDLRYRIDTQNHGDIDVDALRNDAFRLAFAQLEGGSVAFGTDAHTLNRFLTMLDQPTAKSGRVEVDKLLIVGNPEQLITLMLLYPHDEIRSLATTGGFEVLDQYRTLRLALRSTEGFNGLALDMELAHD
ncbi:hypothetical protein [Ruegeria lacuscaerulensis]|uniref:hypothetical protein n=1 Tax=Ruegeria lacuscaerulensis TaxID=55218 RepID=UPI00147ECB3F|nr:hypothetical protein [Ruegeria lacuscaerulensis]